MPEKCKPDLSRTRERGHLSLLRPPPHGQGPGPEGGAVTSSAGNAGAGPRQRYRLPHLPANPATHARHTGVTQGVLDYAHVRQVAPRLSAQLDQGRTDLVMTPAPEERRSSTSTAWDIEDVATYLKISTRHLSDIRAEDPSFPPPRHS